MKKNKDKEPAGNTEPVRIEVPADPFNPNEMSVLEVIARCGALRYSLTQIVALMRPRMSANDINGLIIALRTSGTSEYEAYETGLTLADFQLQSQLLAGAAYDKDLYDAFTSEQRKQAVNAALADKFGIGGKD